MSRRDSITQKLFFGQVHLPFLGCNDSRKECQHPGYWPVLDMIIEVYKSSTVKVSNALDSVGFAQDLSSIIIYHHFPRWNADHTCLQTAGHIIETCHDCHVSNTSRLVCHHHPVTKKHSKKHRGSHFGTNQWRRHAIGPGGAVGARMMVGVVSVANRILRDRWQIYEWPFQVPKYGWLVVSNIFIFHIIWDVILPIDELHHFSRWLVYHQPDEFSFILLDSDDILIIFMINSLMYLLDGAIGAIETVCLSVSGGEKTPPKMATLHRNTSGKSDG